MEDTIDFKTVEDAMMVANGYKEKMLFSLDIYLDDFKIKEGKQFVVKIHRIPIKNATAVYFRNNNLLDSMLQAIAWLDKTTEWL